MIVETNLIRYRAYNAYLAWNGQNRTKDHGAADRVFPSFSTRGKQITPPADVASHVQPLLDAQQGYWSGQDVFQLKLRSDHDRQVLLGQFLHRVILV